MKVLVTGGTGLVGNNVVRTLAGRGVTPRVLARPTADSRPLAGLDVELASGDVRDADSVERATDGVDAVVHAAALVHFGWTRLDEQRRVNVDGTRNVARAAARRGAKLIHVSSVDALAPGAPDRPADEDSPLVAKHPCGYVTTKREAEQVVLDEVGRGLAGVIVNPGFMLGPWDWKPSSGRMLVALSKRFTPLAPTGGLSVCDVRDVADAIVTALDRGVSGRRYILAGHNLRYFDLWKRIARLVGGRPPWMPMGPMQRIIGGWLGDLRTRVTGVESDVNSAAIQMSTLVHYYSSRRAERELGYRVRPLDESLQASWDWLREYGYA